VVFICTITFHDTSTGFVHPMIKPTQFSLPSMETLIVFAASHCCLGYFPPHLKFLPNHHP